MSSAPCKEPAIALSFRRDGGLSCWHDGDRAEESRMPIITMAQTKGGSGKTTTAEVLIAELAYRGSRVAAVDLDPNRPLGRFAASPLRRTQRPARPGADRRAGRQQRAGLRPACPPLHRARRRGDRPHGRGHAGHDGGDRLLRPRDRALAGVRTRRALRHRDLAHDPGGRAHWPARDRQGRPDHAHQSHLSVPTRASTPAGNTPRPVSRCCATSSWSARHSRR